MKDERFLVMEWEWLEDSLGNDELESLFGLLDKASEHREDQSYIVIPVHEFGNKFKYNSEKPRPSRDEVLSTLRELAGVRDVEVAHAEADEILLRYIDDTEIEKAYDEVSKCYC